jgi:ABC-type sugar transport system ATPase subunit
MNPALTAGTTTPGREIALEASGVRKSYGGVKALTGARLTLRAGQIHGLIGENGSGKSTLLGILSGQMLPDAGDIRVCDIVDPSQRDLRGHVALVSQELSLAPDLSVAENILMSHDKPRSWRGIDWRAVNATAAEALERLNLAIDPRAEVGRLRIDQQQMVEIARAVGLGHPILILDEPTSSLTGDEVDSFFAVIRRLRDQGTAIVIVSHRLDELMSITDQITVLRDGQTVDSRPTSQYTRELLTEQMLGYAPEAIPHTFSLTGRTSEPVLAAEHVSVPGSVHEVSISVHRGEIVGLFGLEGSGRTVLLEAIFGAHSGTTGSVRIGGSDHVPGSPRAAMQRGLALVPADRKRDGLMLDMSITANLALAASAGGWRLRAIRRHEESQGAAGMARRVHLQRGSSGRAAAALSGGNQQKVLLGKWLATQPAALLLDEPTRGVDVNAKREIHALVADARDQGMAVIVSSSDMEELLALSDRVAVMFRGRLVAQVDRREATESTLIHLATGGTR